MNVLKKVPHRHFVFSIPKILRHYFFYDRKLLADLSRCAWESLKVFLRAAILQNDPIPGGVIVFVSVHVDKRLDGRVFVEMDFTSLVYDGRNTPCRLF
ncbi:MAG: hypothetical protein JW943_12580 [Deltaproteobacteria bacterium]|nr:hypothetical protein [Deltaproteobacteria bacterium]